MIYNLQLFRARDDMTVTEQGSAKFLAVSGDKQEVIE